MKINLSISERFGIRNLLNEVYQKGGLTLEMLVSAQKIMADINIEIEFNKEAEKDGTYKAIKGEEAIAVNLRQVITPQGAQLLWNKEKDTPKPYELDDKEVNLLKEIIKSKSEKKELSISDNYLIELSEKLNA